MRRLSSRWTILPKYVLPALMVGLLGVAVWRAEGWTERGLYLVLLGFAVFSTAAFAYDLCDASLDGETLVLRGVRGQDRVALTEIKTVAAFTRSKWPHIDLVFRRRTALGAEIRLMPGGDFWGTYDLLARHAETRRHDDEDDASHRRVSGKHAPLAFGLALVLVGVVITFVIALK